MKPGDLIVLKKCHHPILHRPWFWALRKDQRNFDARYNIRHVEPGEVMLVVNVGFLPTPKREMIELFVATRDVIAYVYATYVENLNIMNNE